MNTSDVNYVKWKDVCTENGVLELFEHYLLLSDKTPLARIQFNQERSVAIHKGKPPVVSLHPKKSNSTKGLWICYSSTNLGRFLPAHALPEGFEKHEEVHGKNLWVFGYFPTTSDLDHLFKEILRFSCLHRTSPATAIYYNVLPLKSPSISPSKRELRGIFSIQSPEL